VVEISVFISLPKFTLWSAADIEQKSRNEEKVRKLICFGKVTDGAS
jgi:hypothetical protein